ncbi:MAG TPA: IPTL-CTERM sorting domain-containing protein [Casimicrobiaceae bacterium]|jgi:IPTL-CTERM motif|nr:IPTL-CTERM sorting domain-containing protein [Casimicrobiaceae bacterium]
MVRLLGVSNRLLSSLVIVTLMGVSQLSLAQVCVDPPPIGGSTGVSFAPPGWNVAQGSPDVINGNGLWPGGGYTVSNVSGSSTSGGTMGLFLNEDTSYVETWTTTLTGLTAGVTYQVAVEWQQATLLPNGGGSGWSGGTLRMTVDGNSTDFTSSGSVSGDTWQVATKVFTASGPTAVLELGHTPTPGIDGMVVADSGAACQIVTGGAPQGLPVPTLSQWALIALMLVLASLTGWRLRRR